MHNPAFPRAPQHLLRVVACWCGYVLRRELRGQCVAVSAIWSGRDIVGWDFEVTTPDAKAAALLAAYLDSGSISPLTEALTRREGTSCFVLLVESTPRFTVRVPLRRFTDKRQ
jgi:hypothetical protein